MRGAQILSTGTFFSRWWEDNQAAPRGPQGDGHEVPDRMKFCGAWSKAAGYRNLNQHRKTALMWCPKEGRKEDQIRSLRMFHAVSGKRQEAPTAEFVRLRDTPKCYYLNREKIQALTFASHFFEFIFFQWFRMQFNTPQLWFSCVKCTWRFRHIQDIPTSGLDESGLTEQVAIDISVFYSVCRAPSLRLCSQVQFTGRYHRSYESLRTIIKIPSTHEICILWE